jgi:hypothetical protein
LIEFAAHLQRIILGFRMFKNKIDISISEKNEFKFIINCEVWTKEDNYVSENDDDDSEEEEKEDEGYTHVPITFEMNIYHKQD